jgi:chitinase
MLQDRDKGGSEVPGRTVTGSRSIRLLQESQRNEIIAAIEKAGLDPSAFDLTDDGSEVRLKNTMSASCFTFYRDKTWRYLGTYFVGYGPEKPFDKSWQTVIPLVRTWLEEVKDDHGALDIW